MTTDTPDRDKLRGYPCPWRSDSTENPQPRHSYKPCDGDCLDDYSCPVLPIFRAHIKLRADHDALRRAVLGDMTAELASTVYRTVARQLHERLYWRRAKHLRALADVVSKP